MSTVLPSHNTFKPISATGFRTIMRCAAMAA